MKIFSAAQIREWDNATIKSQSISSLMLMERAAQACTDWIVAYYSISTPFVVVCGWGNNGGDGLAIARQLSMKGYCVKVFLLMVGKELSPDCRANFEAFKMTDPGALQLLQEENYIENLPESIVIIDAIFGTGIHKKLEGYLAKFVARLNNFANTRISVDVPSGLVCDSIPEPEAVIVKATHTLTFQQYKRGMLHPEGGAFCGEVHVLNIGLDKAFGEMTDSLWNSVGMQEIQKIYRPRQRFSHKGNYGTAMLVGGSYGMVGAIVLAASAATRAGAGKVKTLLPKCGYAVIQSAVPEVMCQTEGDNFLNNISCDDSVEALGVGPGLGMQEETVKAFRTFLEKVNKPIVIDADALNILGLHPEWISFIPKHAILTPHPKEFEKLFGKTNDSFDRVELARSKAQKLQIIIVAKDAYTFIAMPDGRCFYNTSGNAGMAKGGSGDVLTGVIAGLLAQGYSPEDSAIMGVYLHGLAGDLAAKERSKEAMIATDIIQHLGAAFIFLEKA